MIDQANFKDNQPTQVGKKIIEIKNRVDILNRLNTAKENNYNL